MMVHVCFLAVEGFYDVIERTRLSHLPPQPLAEGAEVSVSDLFQPRSMAADQGPGGLE